MMDHFYVHTVHFYSLLLISTNKCTYLYWNIKLCYQRSYVFRCFCTIRWELWYCVCWRCKILKLFKRHKTVDRCMIKSVLLINCGSGCICNSKVCNELIWSIIMKPYYIYIFIIVITQDKQCTYHVTLRRVRATIVVVGKQ